MRPPWRQEFRDSAPENLHTDAEKNEGGKAKRNGGAGVAKNSLNAIRKRKAEIDDQRERGIGGERREIEQKAVLQRIVARMARAERDHHGDGARTGRDR